MMFFFIFFMTSSGRFNRRMTHSSETPTHNIYSAYIHVQNEHAFSTGVRHSCPAAYSNLCILIKSGKLRPTPLSPPLRPLSSSLWPNSPRNIVFRPVSVRYRIPVSSDILQVTTYLDPYYRLTFIVCMLCLEQN